MVKSEILIPKSETNPKFKIPNPKRIKIRPLIIWAIALLFITSYELRVTSYEAFAQAQDLEFTIDLDGATLPLPRIFSPNVDLSGRGLHPDPHWPQNLSSPEALDAWGKSIGFTGLYRLQYNLWEITQLAKNRALQNKLLEHYENIIKNISDSGGIVILNIFGTPAGLGKALDKKSPPINLAAFKELLKEHIRNLSCLKHYNIWYEVWSAPDLDDFFVGRKQEYLNLYRTVAEACKELEREFKINIPVGGPSTSWWFQNIEPNTVVNPERSLIYELIRFCYHYRLPLDFISWHAYSTDPHAEKELTLHKKPVLNLIRDWLGYFKFGKNTPLIVDEWNFDRNLNLAPERGKESCVAGSYLLARLKNMQAAGLDQQALFCLEDFRHNKEGIERNTGVFWYDPEAGSDKAGPKCVYNVLWFLKMLGKNMFVLPKEPGDEFIGLLAAKDGQQYAIILYNYIDPDAALNFLSRNIAALSAGERKFVLNIIKSDKVFDIISGKVEINSLRTTNRARALFKKAKELNALSQQALTSPRRVRLTLKKTKDNYLLQNYAVDADCAAGGELKPVEEKEIPAQAAYAQDIVLKPYSAQLIVLKPKPPTPAAQPESFVSNTTQ